MLKAGTFKANMPLKIKVKYEYYQSLYGNDYTVKTYAKPAAQIKDKNGKTNMIHMDGTSPSGFTNSKFTGYKGPWIYYI